MTWVITKDRFLTLPRVFAAVTSLLMLCACTLSGPMDISQIHYLAVPSGEDVNYFRIRVEGETRFSDANFHSGWYPAYDVDKLFGGVATSSGNDQAEARITELAMKEKLNKAITDAYTKYLEVARDPGSSDDRILAYLETLRRVRATAGDGIPLPPGAVEVEWNPGANLALRHAGEKLIFVLAADPNEVINAIKISERTTNTSADILQLSKVIRQQSQNEVLEIVSENESNKKLDNLIVSQIESSLTELSVSDLTEDVLLEEIDALLLLIESLR